MKVIVDFDDFSPLHNRFDLLEELREHYPDFKVTMFTVPWEIRYKNPAPITDEKHAGWVSAVKASKWIEIAVHGLTHFPLEFAELTYDEAHKRIVVAEKMFINRGIEFVKLFKAPYWALSDEAKQAAQDLGYTVAENHYYNWNLADECPFTPEQILNDDGYLVAHGHVTKEGCDNYIEDAMPKLMKLPPGTQFITLSEFFKETNYGN